MSRTITSYPTPKLDTRRHATVHATVNTTGSKDDYTEVRVIKPNHLGSMFVEYGIYRLTPDEARELADNLICAAKITEELNRGQE